MIGSNAALKIAWAVRQSRELDSRKLRATFFYQLTLALMADALTGMGDPSVKQGPPQQFESLL
jgi:hypothetical protein